jgi:hypothetical protein
MGFTSAEITDERKEKLRKLASKFCSAMMYSDEVFVKRAMSVTTKFLQDYNGVSAVTNKNILSFLNDNRAYLFCDNREGEKIHYMEYALNKNKTEKVFSRFLNELMSESDGLVPNVNVMIAPNKTLLDAMAEKLKEVSWDPELKKNMESEIRAFRRDYQAKYFHELAPLSK